MIAARLAAAIWFAASLPGQELSVDVTAPEAAASGLGFELTVRRSWPADLLADPFESTSLAPLLLRETHRDVVTAAGQTVETRRFQAYAFGEGPVNVPTLVLTARPLGGGAPRTARTEPFVVEVSPLPAEGPVELPGGLVPMPGRGWPLTPFGTALLLVIAGSVAHFGWRRHLAQRRRALAPRPPEEIALTEFAAARRALHAGTDAHATARAIGRPLRAYLAATHDGAELCWSSEELQHRIPDSSVHELLAVLDGVKFEAVRTDADAQHELITRCEQFVRETSS